MITYGKALAIYRQYHPDGPEPASEQTIPLSVNGLGTNWHLRTAGGQYIATIKNEKSQHGRITYKGPRGRGMKQERSIIPLSEQKDQRA